MLFKATKEKGYTRIVFRSKEKWRVYLFILFLWFQSLLVYTVGLFYTWAQELLLFSVVLGAFVSILILLGLWIQKSLKLTQEGISIEYALAGLLMFKRILPWSELSKVAVEQDRLKTHDILFVTQKKSIFLHEAMDEDSSDALLKEIQLFNHYQA
jgi:hypothetical protein